MATQTTSLFPADSRYEIPLASVMNMVADQIDATRWTGKTFETALTEFFTGLAIELPQTASAKQIGDEMWELIKVDETYDSEYAMAHRAADVVLPKVFGEQVFVTSWLSGHEVVVDNDGFRETFRIIADACPRCEINPLASGIGGGVRCIDTRGCGYWYCA